MKLRSQLIYYETEIPLQEITGQEKVTGLFVSQLNTIIIIDHVGIPRVKFIMLYKAVKADEHDKGQKLTSLLNQLLKSCQCLGQKTDYERSWRIISLILGEIRWYSQEKTWSSLLEHGSLTVLEMCNFKCPLSLQYTNCVVTDLKKDQDKKMRSIHVLAFSYFFWFQ